MLTNAAAKAAGAQARAYKLHDQGGLHLLVRPTGSKSWQLKYRWRGREKLLTLGQFPEVNVSRARILQAEAKEQLAAGVDPGRKAAAGDTLEQLARLWYSANLPAWSEAHAEDVLASLKRDIFPELGALAAGSVTAPQLLAAIEGIAQRGCRTSAHRVRQRLAEIFAFGRARGLVSGNPAADLGAAMLSPPPARPHAAITDLCTLRKLLAACDRDAARAETILASRFLALTAVRLAAVRGMVWAEVDLEARTWTVPAGRMKLSRAKKDDARFGHVVPLSEAAVAVLEQVAPRRNIGRRSDIIGKTSDFIGLTLVFPGRDGGPIAAGAIRELYDRAGFAGRHVPHGWRASFSTILNEELGPGWRFDIDAALGHAGKGKVEAAYNRSAQLGRRRELMDRWGALLSQKA
ncbi:MAG: integrase [Erythrobacter sp.]|nr:integrase [Erythrobacter sp.]MBA4080387.1 integrase [Erythrobacter sp.]MBA4164469.1 integrase [Erythrobacter sp.]